jgi:Holliday junction resolvase-like predicted endonuclease
MGINPSIIESASLGRKAEEAVRVLLTHKGLREVTHNYSAHLLGELDLVFLKGDTLYFFEVRLRKEGGGFDGPAESIGPLKKKRICNSARHLIASYGLTEYDVSFWAACVAYSTGENIFKVKFLPF